MTKKLGNWKINCEMSTHARSWRWKLSVMIVSFRVLEKSKRQFFLQRMRKSRQTDDMKRLNCTQNHHLFRLRLFMDYSTDHSQSIQHQLAIAIAIAIVTKINKRKITLKTLVFL